MQCGPKQLLFYERISGKTFHSKRCLKMQHFLDGIALLSAQSSLSIFAQKYFCKWKDTYFILQNKYLGINKDSFGAKILRYDCTLRVNEVVPNS